jgi:hypothetical protein
MQAEHFLLLRAALTAACGQYVLSSALLAADSTSRSKLRSARNRHSALITSLHCNDRFVFIMDTDSVLCEVRTEQFSICPHSATADHHE